MRQSDNEPAPRVWALYGARQGDNEQVQALAAALGWPVEAKRLAYKKRYFNRCYKTPNILLQASPRALTPASRESLCPPWPDLVLAVGRRSSAAALWIKRQSGGKTRLVHLGRPRAPLHLFDLVITTPQYGLPDLENVLQLSLPLQAEDDGSPDQVAELESWRDRFSAMPRPWTGVFVGGTAWPFVFDGTAAKALAADLNHFIGGQGGAALVSTSPRSGAAVADALDRDLAVPHHFHRWQARAANPFDAILALADRFIVTGDSVSMLAQACRAGKPVAIWNPPRSRHPLSQAWEWLGRQSGEAGPIGRLMRFTATSGLFAPPRAVARVQEALIASQAACWFDRDRSIEAPRAKASHRQDIERVRDRVRALFGSR